jgi:hypothetical protein
MKRILLSIFVLLSLVGVSACSHSGIRGNGELQEETRKVDDFNAIEAGGIFRVYVEVGSEPTLKIEAEENLLQYIETRVSGSTLILDQRKNLNPREHITVYVTVPELNRVESSGASKFFVENINSEDFRLSVSGAGKVKLVGTAEKLNADISGAADLDAFDFKCKNVDLDVSGASKAEVYCSGILKSDISGVGKVIYDGSPENIYSDISGLGKVSSR